MKVLICGDRNWDNRLMIDSFVRSLAKDTVIIEGEASGADCIARQSGEKYGLEVEKFPAEWEKYGKSAGPIRNSQMLKRNPDIVVAFHNNIKESRGTKDTVTKALKMNVPVLIVSEYF